MIPNMQRQDDKPVSGRAAIGRKAVAMKNGQTKRLATTYAERESSGLNVRYHPTLNAG